MESEDYPFFQGLVYLLENDVSTLGYELTFSTEVSFHSPFSGKWKIDSVCIFSPKQLQMEFGREGLNPASVMLSSVHQVIKVPIILLSA